MYLMDADLYECDYCGHQSKWDMSDAQHGSMWECECCGKTFCESCFTGRFGIDAFLYMCHHGDKVLCPICYAGETHIHLEGGILKRGEDDA